MDCRILSLRAGSVMLPKPWEVRSRAHLPKAAAAAAAVQAEEDLAAAAAEAGDE